MNLLRKININTVNYRYYKKGNATITEVFRKDCLKKLKNNAKTIFYSFTKILLI